MTSNVNVQFGCVSVKVPQSCGFNTMFNRTWQWLGATQNTPIRGGIITHLTECGSGWGQPLHQVITQKLCKSITHQHCIGDSCGLSETENRLPSHCQTSVTQHMVNHWFYITSNNLCKQFPQFHHFTSPSFSMTFPWPMLFFQAWKMVLLNSVTFHDVPSVGDTQHKPGITFTTVQACVPFLIPLSISTRWLVPKHSVGYRGTTIPYLTKLNAWFKLAGHCQNCW